MLYLIETLLRQLHRTWRSMGGSSYQSMLTLLVVAYIALSIELLAEFLRSWIRRGGNPHDDMRRIQTLNQPPRSRQTPTPVNGP